MTMRTVPVTEFKAHALEMINDVSKTREGLVITKRGKPVVQVLPYQESTARPRPGKLSAYFVSEKDIVSPLGADQWEASR